MCLRHLIFPALLLLTTGAFADTCVDTQHNSLAFEGTLTYHIFAGPPNYEDVRKGDSPEPAYILKLDAPVCAAGDEDISALGMFDKIQLLVDEFRQG